MMIVHTYEEELRVCEKDNMRLMLKIAKKNTLIKQLLEALKEIEKNIKELRDGTRGMCDGELERIGFIARKARAEEE
jgi:hypothetical protein